MSVEQGGMSAVKQALVEIRRLKEELARERQARSEPIAVVGVGLRFPGADDLESFWELLRDGRDAVGPIPSDRWDHDANFDPSRERPDRYYVRHGGFLRQVDGFDPEFFGIAPIEAEMMDPQQRLVLETAWEALEHAGIPAGGLAGSRTGVFLGIATADYHRLIMAEGERVDAYASSGTAGSVAAGRVSYLLGLNGPAISIDTACSSSLVAVHLAATSLRSGESDLALAAGVNLMLAPETTVDFCAAGMLSPDGRCSTFDAGANGYIRSEGCGVVVLKRLSDAERDGDRVLALVRGSAVNQDGRSSGLTAPSGPAQEAVIRTALAAAGLKATDISYLEAHGTGTSLGDPIEAQALGAAYGEGRDASDPLWIGSVKTNLGHLEAAAGMAGLIKAIEAVRRGVIPPHLHFSEPNPLIRWDDLPLAVATEARTFDSGRVARAGVSSFGFSGTNAHVIVEAVEERTARSEGRRANSAEAGPEVLVLSAPQETGLRALAEVVAEFLATSGEPFADICAAAAVGRTHFTERLAVVAGDAAEAGSKLTAWLAGEKVADVYRELASSGSRVSVSFGDTAGSDAQARADAYIRGGTPRWSGETPAPRVTLPSYPFQRRRFWFRKKTGPAGEAELTADLSASTAGKQISTAPTGSSARRTGRQVAAGDLRTSPAPNEAAGGGSAGTPWDAALAAGLARAGVSPVDAPIAHYGAAWAALEELTERIGQNALIELGAFDTPGEHTVEGVLAAAGIGELYAPIVRRWLDAMVRRGALTGGADASYAPARVERLDVESAWDRVRELLAFDQPLLRYLEHTAPLVPDVLAGQVAPLETLFPDGSFELAADLYENSAVLRYINGIAAATLDAFVRSLPADRPIRVLEVGAGTGGSTASLLPILPHDRSAYVYTDVSDVFLDFGREKFAGRENLTTTLFDLERDPVEQGFDPGSFDVVIAANVIHAARDVRAALLRVHSLLAPGGLAMFVESTGHHAWHDISTGLIEGWQHFTDDLRADTPLLPPEVWRAILVEAGFDAAATLPGEESAAGVLKQHLVVGLARGERRKAKGERRKANSEQRTAKGERRTAKEDRRRGKKVVETGASRTGGAADPAPPRIEASAEAATAEGERSGSGEAGPARVPTSPADTADFPARLRAAIGAEREELAIAAVRDRVIEVLRADPDHPPSRDARLMDLGLDSLMAVRLRNLLQKTLGLPKKLPATLVFDYPSIRQIAMLVIKIVIEDEAADDVSSGRAAVSSGGPREGSATDTASPTSTSAADPDDDLFDADESRRAEVAAMSDDEIAAMLDLIDLDDLG